MDNIDHALVQGFAPTGRLRASINLGNVLLAGKDAATGRLFGISVDIAQALADKLGVPLELVAFDTAAKSVEAVSTEAADVGFFAIDPLRGASIAFTDAYALIEGYYLVHADSTIVRHDQVDVASNRVVVGKGSAYDLHLSRELKHATIVRADSSSAVVDTFVTSKAEVAAGVRQQLELDAKRISGLRLLDGRFMVIRQAMGSPRSRGERVAAFLHNFVEHLKSSGFVQAAVTKHRITGVSVAPPHPLHLAS